MSEIKTQPQLIIPEGKMAAPSDHRIVRQRLILPSGDVSTLDLIKQTREGNCSEYTTINSMLLLKAAGFEVARIGTIDINIVEPKLIRLIADGLEITKGTTIREEDYECLIEKIDNPYITLTGNDTAILFRMMVAPRKELDFTGDIFLNSNKCFKKILLEQNTAVLIGSNVHATSIIKINESFYDIDPYFSPEPIKKFNQSELMEKISRKLDILGSFAVVNQI